MSKTLMEGLHKVLKESPRLKAVPSLQHLLTPPGAPGSLPASLQQQQQQQAAAAAAAAASTQQSSPAATARHWPRPTGSSVGGSPGVSRPGSGTRMQAALGTSRTAAAAAAAAGAAAGAGGGATTASGALLGPTTPAAAAGGGGAGVTTTHQVSLLKSHLVTTGARRTGFTMGKVTSNASDELSQGSHFTLMVVGCDSLAALRRSLDQMVRPTGVTGVFLQVAKGAGVALPHPPPVTAASSCSTCTQVCLCNHYGGTETIGGQAVIVLVPCLGNTAFGGLSPHAAPWVTHVLSGDRMRSILHSTPH
jgi:hypothetical protein